MSMIIDWVSKAIKSKGLSIDVSKPWLDGRWRFLKSEDIGLIMLRRVEFITSITNWDEDNEKF